MAPRVPCHDLPLAQPVPQPGQLAVAVEGVGEKVPAHKKEHKGSTLTTTRQGDLQPSGARQTGWGHPLGHRTYSVERDCSVSKAPGAIVLIWLSYRESRRTLRSPVKLSL